MYPEYIAANEVITGKFICKFAYKSSGPNRDCIDIPEYGYRDKNPVHGNIIYYK
jgi:hypothetical protein